MIQTEVIAAGGSGNAPMIWSGGMAWMADFPDPPISTMAASAVLEPLSIPWGRFGMPEEIARVALFLASDMASWVTGQTIVVDQLRRTRQLPQSQTMPSNG